MHGVILAYNTWRATPEVSLTHRMAPRRIDPLSGLSALLLLALGTSMSPALAATNADSRRDQSAESPAMSDVRTNHLILEVVDHGESQSAAPGQLSVDSAIEAGGSVNSSTIEPPRVESLLRRIFDEPQLRTPEISTVEEADERSAPLAVDKSDNIEKPASAVPGKEASNAAPRMPGVSSDELLRFKQQMYRTDI